MRKFKDVNELVNALKPDYPVYCIRPESIKTSTNFFKKNFPGKVLYAVKTNPNENVLRQIISNGIEHFDVASVNEIKLIKKLKEDAKLYYMHTVKSRENISEAYFKLGVRDFALDTKISGKSSSTHQASLPPLIEPMWLTPFITVPL